MENKELKEKENGLVLTEQGTYIVKDYVDYNKASQNHITGHEIYPVKYNYDFSKIGPDPACFTNNKEKLAELKELAESSREVFSTNDGSIHFVSWGGERALDHTHIASPSEAAEYNNAIIFDAMTMSPLIEPDGSKKSDFDTDEKEILDKAGIDIDKYTIKLPEQIPVATEKVVNDLVERMANGEDILGEAEKYNQEHYDSKKMGFIAPWILGIGTGLLAAGVIMMIGKLLS